jgi:hypothetical protein
MLDAYNTAAEGGWECTTHFTVTLFKDSRNNTTPAASTQAPEQRTFAQHRIYNVTAPMAMALTSSKPAAAPCKA